MLNIVPLFGLFPLIDQMSFHYPLSFLNSCFTLLESKKDKSLHRLISETFTQYAHLKSTPNSKLEFKFQVRSWNKGLNRCVWKIPLHVYFNTNSYLTMNTSEMEHRPSLSGKKHPEHLVAGEIKQCKDLVWTTFQGESLTGKKKSYFKMIIPEHRSWRF